MDLKEKVLVLETTLQQIKTDYVSKDKLEAEISKAKLQGVKVGAVIASLLFAGIGALAAVIALF